VAISKKVENSKLVIQENIELALQNAIKLETIEKCAGMNLLIIYIYIYIYLHILTI
jgi:hypothetical protein